MSADYDQTTPHTIELKSVPRELYPQHSWLYQGNNRDALRIWLEKHQVDIKVVQSIRFNNNSFSTVEYKWDKTGNTGQLLPAVAHKYLPGLKPKLLYEGRARSG